MKFHLAINLERLSDNFSMKAARDHTLEMVKLADKGGFEIVWAAEHHALEMTIAPNPFQLLTWWAQHTSNIRLGCGVVNAAYWHPIRLAGEAAMLDLISDGRLEFGIGSGAYQREFDRMKPGLKQSDSYKYVHEMLPLLQKLWQGDIAHDGEYWQFPKSTSCPKPLQDQVPIWLAARSPITFEYAVKQNSNIMSWPLTMPMSEAENYKARLDAAIAEHNPYWSGKFAMMRHSCVYDNPKDKNTALTAVQNILGQFGNVMFNKGDVINGFPQSINIAEIDSPNVNKPSFDANSLETNLLFGSPEQVIEKLEKYKNLGLDSFIYYASMGLGYEEQIRSLELFIDEVIPAIN